MSSSRPSVSSGPPIGVGIVGLGRSGWNIHATALRRMPGTYQVAAICDPVEARRQEAVGILACRAYDSFAAMLEDPGVELVVVASPNHLHTPHAIDAMRAGRHVVCEKPFALSVEDADRMNEVADQTGRVLAPFQNRRYEPHFLKVRELVRTGVLGEVVLVRMVWQQFNRRWDWQTLGRFGGGLLNNNGSHLLDHALQFMDESAEIEIFADLRRVLSLGDTEDHVKIVLTAEGHPTIDIELTSACAYPQDRWLVMGSAGGLRGTMDHLEWKTVDWSKLPPRQVETEAAPDRVYNREELPWQTFTWSRTEQTGEYEYRGFYNDLWATIRDGRPLAVTPRSVRRLIRVLERCHERCPQLV